MITDRYTSAEKVTASDIEGESELESTQLSQMERPSQRRKKRTRILSDDEDSGSSITSTSVKKPKLGRLPSESQSPEISRYDVHKKSKAHRNSKSRTSNKTSTSKSTLESTSTSTSKLEKYKINITSRDLNKNELDKINLLTKQLRQCGIIKQWKKELLPCNSNFEKINYLKTILKDIGMNGRFSQIKAKKIKENLELKKELEGIGIDLKKIKKNNKIKKIEVENGNEINNDESSRENSNTITDNETETDDKTSNSKNKIKNQKRPRPAIIFDEESDDLEDEEDDYSESSDEVIPDNEDPQDVEYTEDDDSE